MSRMTRDGASRGASVLKYWWLLPTLLALLLVGGLLIAESAVTPPFLYTAF